MAESGVYTKFGYNIEIRGFRASYASPQMIGHAPPGSRIPIYKGQNFWGRLDFEYKSPDDFYCTPAFYLWVNGVKEYTYGYLYCPKSTDWRWIDYYTDNGVLGVFDPQGLPPCNLIDTVKELWIGWAVPPQPTDYLMLDDGDTECYHIGGVDLSWLQIISAIPYKV